MCCNGFDCVCVMFCFLDGSIINCGSMIDNGNSLSIIEAENTSIVQLNDDINAFGVFDFILLYFSFSFEFNISFYWFVFLFLLVLVLLLVQIATVVMQCQVLVVLIMMVIQVQFIQV